MSVRTFQSWKEIAQYMGRGVRTVQRWEAFGLPVHRPAGRERSAVFAIEHELDAWMQQTQTQVCRPLHTNGNGSGDAALITRIQEVENEVRELREQIAMLHESRRFIIPETQAA
jgi:hypothetical protein